MKDTPFNNLPTRRAMVTALLFLSSVFSVFAQGELTPQTALMHYVEKSDPSFRWEVKDSVKQGKLTVYQLLLTSQTWKDTVWTHQLSLIVPDSVRHDGALLYIAGGAIENGRPKWNTNPEDRHLQVAYYIAENNGAVVALLRQTPNQPLYGGKKEDELISMTLHQYKKSKDYEWPLLFPMVKSAVRAMDAVQQFSESHREAPINRFVVTGLSKRGWTTWLTGAVDDRVVAITPMVIDVLNMPVSLQYQIATWGDYSIEIQDYVRLGIPQSATTPGGQEITAMVDPYSYRKYLDMPKLLIMGTNDPYWVVDNVKNYLDSIPGENRLHYVPNAGHDLGDGKQASEALSAFFGTVLRRQPLPEVDWTWIPKRDKAKLRIKATRSKLTDVVLWTASSTDKDFRDDRWTPHPLGIARKGTVNLSLPYPKEGYSAHYVDLHYESALGGTYTQSTRVFVTDNKGIWDTAITQASRTDSILTVFHTQPQTVLVAAHRGAHRHHPENSLAAIGAAIQAGAHIVELDVRQTADGELVVMHDTTLDRTTNGQGSVASTTYQQIRDLALTHEGEPTDQRIPTLREALLRCKDSIVVDIDFKASTYEAAKQACELVASLDMEEQVLFFLYDYKEMPRLHTLNPRVKIMPRAYSPEDLQAILAMDMASVIHIDGSYYDAALLAPLTKKGIRIWANTLGGVDKEKGYAAFFREMAGVNIVQTDEPEALMHYLRRHN